MNFSMKSNKHLAVGTSYEIRRVCRHAYIRSTKFDFPRTFITEYSFMLIHV